MKLNYILVFKSLVYIIAILMVISFVTPWWVVTFSGMAPEEEPVEVNSASVKIYAYGLTQNLDRLSGYLRDETPLFLTVMAFIYLSISICILLIGTWVKGDKSAWLIGGIGLIYIMYAVIAIVWIAKRVTTYGISFQGHTLIERTLDIKAGVQFPYYLAIIVGLLLVILGVLHRKVINKL